MSIAFGKNIRVALFGESHGAAIGCEIEGLPAGFRPDMDALQAFLARRAPGNSALATQRRETDAPEFLSGLQDGILTGAPVCAIIRNQDQHSRDYAKLADCPRPGHADFPAAVKYKGFNDIRGGGHFSARLTAPLCVAGGLALQILKLHNILIYARAYEIAGVRDIALDAAAPAVAALEAAQGRAIPVLEERQGRAMTEAIQAARARGDSVGGIVETFVLGLPVGVGGPLFDGLDGALAWALFGIPAVKGVEFGEGFGAARLCGSQNNDAFCLQEGQIRTNGNRSGGILGGMSNGMPLHFRVAFKPTPSIAMEQQSVSFSGRREETLRIEGRHDPCVVPRAVPVVEAVSALAILDAVGCA